MTDTTMTLDQKTGQQAAPAREEAEMPPAIRPATERDPLRARIEDFSFYYSNGFQAIKHVDMPILDRKVTAIIGPIGLRQIHVVAQPESDARPVSGQSL